MTKDTRRDRMMQRLLQAFRDFGYSQLTMGGLANACDLSPRALYNHFKGKEDAFCEATRWNQAREISCGWEAGKWRLADGGNASEAIVAILDARFGEACRQLETSPHSSELGVETYRRCRDIMDESAVEFHVGFAAVLTDLEKRGLIRLHPNQSAVDAAELLTDGARGVNQTLPNISSNALVDRYRRMCEGLLYGIADRTASQSLQTSPRREALVEGTRPEGLRPLRIETAARAEGTR